MDCFNSPDFASMVTSHVRPHDVEDKQARLLFATEKPDKEGSKRVPPTPDLFPSTVTEALFRSPTTYEKAFDIAATFVKDDTCPDRRSQKD